MMRRSSSFSITLMLSMLAAACSSDVPSGTTSSAERVDGSFRRFQMIEDGDEVPHLITTYKKDIISRFIERGLEGNVTLELHITKEGIVAGSSVYQSSGHKELDDIALEAAREMTFTSAKRNGEPYDAIFILPMVFRMPDDYKITKTTQVADVRRKTAQ